MKRSLLLWALLVCAAGSAWPQAQSNPVGEVHFNKPKAGMQFQYEEARKRHMAWHKAQNDKWSWVTWEILTGPRTGAYMIVSPGHRWAEFDAREQFNMADAADADKNMGGLLADEGMSYWIQRNDLSRNPNWDKPAKYISVTRYWIDPAAVNVFTESVKKVNAGMDKIKYPAKPSRWFQLANGGDGVQFVLHTDRSNMADMEPLDKNLDEAMAEAYGKAEGAALMDTIRKAIKESQTELRLYRTDLSYMPGK